MRLPSILFLALSVACGGAPETTSTTAAEPALQAATSLPSTAEAKELIGSSPVLGDFEFTKAAITLPMQKSAMNVPALENAKQLAKAGWIDLSGDTIELAKGRNDPRFLVRPNGSLDVVPIAKKEMGDVTAVRATPDGNAEADFTFQWLPTEVGSAFISGTVHELFAQPVQARAVLLWDGTSWSVLSIARERQSPD